MKPYAIVALAQSGLSAINALELFNACEGSLSDDCCLILSPRDERRPEIERVIQVYRPTCDVLWAPRWFGAADVARAIRSPFYRSEQWISALIALMKEPRLRKGTSLLALSLWPLSYQQHFRRFMRPERVIAFDDGATTLSWAKQFDSVDWFTAYNIADNRIWQKNEYQYTRRLIADVVSTDHAWFIGQPLIREREIPLNEYLAIVSRAIEWYGVTDYFPHPAEKRETLARVEQLGIDVKRPAAPIELHPIEAGVPRYVVGVSSAAIANFKLLYGDTLRCAAVAPGQLMTGFFASWYESVARMGVEVVRFTNANITSA